MSENTGMINTDLLEKEEAQIYDTGTERAFLACIMKEPKLMHEASHLVTIHDLYNKFTKGVYQVMLYLYKRQSKEKAEASYDTMSMLAVAKSLGEGKEENMLSLVGGLDHLQSIESAPIKIGSFKQYISILLEKSAKVQAYRKARGIQLKAINQAPVDRATFVSEIQQEMFDMSTVHGGDRNIIKLGEEAERFLGEMVENKKAGRCGIRATFMPKIMRVLNGFRGGNLIIIYARPKTGKSAMFLNIAVDVACEQNIPVLYLDTEMSKNEQLSRAMSRWAGVEEWDITNGTFEDDPEKMNKVQAIAQKLKGSPFYYASAMGITKEEVVSLIRQFKVQFVGEELVGGRMKTKPCLIVYDWIKVNDSNQISRNTQEWQTLGYIATAIKNVATELDIPVVAGAQSNRGGAAQGVTGKSAEHSSTFLAGSDRMAQYCTCLIWLRWLRESEQKLVDKIDPEFYYNQMMHVIMQRGGPTCQEGVPFFYEGKKITYHEVDVPEDIFKLLSDGGVSEENFQKNKKKKTVEDSEDEELGILDIPLDDEPLFPN